MLHKGRPRPSFDYLPTGCLPPALIPSIPAEGPSQPTDTFLPAAPFWYKSPVTAHGVLDHVHVVDSVPGIVRALATHLHCGVHAASYRIRPLFQVFPSL